MGGAWGEPQLFQFTSEEAWLLADCIRARIGTGWADPKWPTDDDLDRLATRLEEAR